MISQNAQKFSDTNLFITQLQHIINLFKTSSSMAYSLQLFKIKIKFLLTKPSGQSY
jgi:hypothetical protein